MTKDDTHSVCLVLVSLLLPTSILCLVGIGERVCAALFSTWKFFGNARGGIGIGANISFAALFSCLFGATVSMLIVYLLKDSGRKWLFRSAVTASVIYFMNGLLLFLLVKSGLAYLYCGR